MSDDFSGKLENHGNKLHQLHINFKEGIVRAIESYLQIRLEIMKTLKGYFNHEELQIVVNTISENDISPSVEAHDELANMCIRSQPFGNTSLYKVEALSGPQLYFLIEEIIMIIKKGKSFNDFINNYALR